MVGDRFFFRLCRFFFHHVVILFLFHLSRFFELEQMILKKEFPVTDFQQELELLNFLYSLYFLDFLVT